MKFCTKCKLEKSTKDFYKDKRRADGLKSWCKDCHNIGVRDWQKQNRAQDLMNKITYIQNKRTDPEYKELERMAHREWVQRNPEYYKQYDKQYRETHPEKGRASDARRRARKLNAMQGDPQEIYDYGLILRQDPCSYCNNPAKAIDHIIPLAKNGNHSWDNLTAACQGCNSSKRDKSFLFWLATR